MPGPAQSCLAKGALPEAHLLLNENPPTSWDLTQGAGALLSPPAGLDLHRGADGAHQQRGHSLRRPVMGWLICMLGPLRRELPLPQPLRGFEQTLVFLLFLSLSQGQSWSRDRNKGVCPPFNITVPGGRAQEGRAEQLPGLALGKARVGAQEQLMGNPVQPGPLWAPKRPCPLSELRPPSLQPQQTNQLG